MKEAQLFCYFLYFSFESEPGERALSGNDPGLRVHGAAVASVCAAVSGPPRGDLLCPHDNPGFFTGMT